MSWKHSHAITTQSCSIGIGSNQTYIARKLLPLGIYFLQDMIDRDKGSKGLNSPLLLGPKADTVMSDNQPQS